MKTGIIERKKQEIKRNRYVNKIKEWPDPPSEKTILSEEGVKSDSSAESAGVQTQPQQWLCREMGLAAVGIVPHILAYPYVMVHHTTSDDA